MWEALCEAELQAAAYESLAAYEALPSSNIEGFAQIWQLWPASAWNVLFRAMALKQLIHECHLLKQPWDEAAPSEPRKSFKPCV